MDTFAHKADGKGDIDGVAEHVSSRDAPSLKEGNVDDLSAVDNAILRAQGHEAAMPRRFGMLPALGLAFSITNSWIGYLSCFGQNLAYGGPQNVILGLLCATFAQGTITLGMSELASAFPSSGGQYHFTYIIASEKTRRFAAFIVGWISIIGWWIVTASGASLASNSIFGMIQFWDDSFAHKSWMVYLVYVAVIMVTALPIFVVPKWIPVISHCSLYLSLFGCLVNFIVLLVMKKHTNPSSYLVEPGLGTSGWGEGTAWVLGVMNAMYAYGGTDAAMHIAEEMHNPGFKLPIIMNLCMVIGACTAFPLFVVLMYGMTDLASVVASPLPSAEVIYQVTGNKAVTTFLMIWIIICYLSGMPSQILTSGRLAWAFARDGGTPYPKFFSKIDKKRDFPVNTTVAAIIFNLLYGLLYLASTTAFNSIITSAVLYLNTSYAIPQAIVAFRGRSKVLPNRALNLRWFGTAINVFAPLWVILLGVLVCFPPSIPVTVASMNYSAVVDVGIFVIFLCFWFAIGKNFHGPRIDFDAINETNTLKTK